MKSKLIILILLITTVVCQGGDASGDTVNKPPNIVFFLVDDLGWSDVGCFGSSFYDTPNIDRLAAEGVRFTDAYAACHVCSPTRASILTGKYPATLNLTDWLNGRKKYSLPGPAECREGHELGSQRNNTCGSAEEIRLCNRFVWKMASWARYQSDRAWFRCSCPTFC